MARGEGSRLEAAMAEVLSEEAIAEAAGRFGVVKRQRKVHPFFLVWTLVLGHRVDPDRTLESLRRLYERASEHTLARSSFHGRFTVSLAKMMAFLARQALAAQDDGAHMLTGSWAAFQEILALDATVLRLHDLLAPSFAATRTNQTQAAAKLHVVANVFDGTASQVKLTSERVADTAPWRRVEDWVRGSLFLLDLGYYRFHLFDRIDAHGGFFLTRAKSTFNGRITAVHRNWPGRPIEVVGQRLQDVLPRLKRGFLDVDVEVSFKKRKYRGKQSTKKRTFRLVAVRNEETGQYHVYLTNVPVDVLPAEDIRATYALRWQVEILFKCLKSNGQLDQLPSSKKAVVEVLVWSSILYVVVSQALYRLVRSIVEAARHLPILRWSIVLAREARELLFLLLGHRTPQQAEALLQHLIHEAPDPNRHRRQRAFQLVPVQTAS